MSSRNYAQEFNSKLESRHKGAIVLLSKYRGSGEISKFRCTAGHITEAKPKTVLQSHGNGCSACGQITRIRKSSEGKFRTGKSRFLGKVESIHKDKIQIIGKYKGSKSWIKVKCTTCSHKWNTTPDRLYDGNGCPPCSIKRGAQANRLIFARYLKKLRKVRGFEYLILEDCRDSYHVIKHFCVKHKTFFHASPQQMLYQSKVCSLCIKDTLANRGLKHRISVEEVDRRIKAKHGRKVTRVGAYVGSLTVTEFKCQKGHTWTTTPDAVMRISGCPKCNSPLGHSRIAVKWIRAFAKKYELKFEHARNTGERSLYGASGRRYYVDGFNQELRLVLEFNGDAWHGNPQCFAPEDTPHPWSKSTAAELDRATKIKALDLTAAGYTVISIWESDWRAGKISSTINHRWWN